MTRLYDGNKTVEISMSNWTDNGYTPDWSADFFDVGCLPYIEEIDAYQVKDVDYCVDQAMDWKNNTGDYIDYDADPEEVDTRTIDVDYI